MFDEYNDMLSVDDLMEILGIGKNAAYDLLRNGELKCFRLKGRWKIPKESVIEYVRSKAFLKYTKAAFQCAAFTYCLPY